MTDVATPITDPFAEGWLDAKGRKVPDSNVSEMDRLIEQTITEIKDHGVELMNRIARYRGHSFDDVNALVALLAEKYNAKRGGAKGNVSFLSYDGSVKVEIRVQDRVTYGPELKIAKDLLGEYIEEVSDGVPDVVHSLLNHAFDVDQQGKVNREQLYSLRRLDIKHPKWAAAMQAIADSMRVVGSVEYFQLSIRDAQGKFKALPINLANAYETDQAGE
tara:strand:- start:285 stop:938 length:654 start_codon:yes stop_codon:yes gene_type:complete